MAPGGIDVPPVPAPIRAPGIVAPAAPPVALSPFPGVEASRVVRTPELKFWTVIDSSGIILLTKVPLG